MWTYPVPARASTRLRDSFNRIYIPGTSRKYQRGKHGGIDITAAELGDKVVAVRDATVVGVGNVWGPAYGKQVLIRYKRESDGEYRYVFYAHLNSISVVKGQRVVKGQKVGSAGTTGQSSGVHVHFEWHTTSSWTTGLLNPFTALEEARRA